MKKIDRKEKLLFSLQAKTKFTKKVKRRQRKHRIKIGWLKYLADIRNTCKKKGVAFVKPSFKMFSYYKSLGLKPEYSNTIQYLASIKNAFSNDDISQTEDGKFLIPEIFSLTDNYSTSFSFLKRLFYCLYFQRGEHISFDYSQCQRIDVDASVCMDILLGEFITYYNKSRRKGHKVKILDITPINYKANHILKVLFSIGAFSSIKGFTIDFQDIIPYPLCIADSTHSKASETREIHITQMVDYVLNCMSKMKLTLTAKAEENLFEVIGEVLINAEEHSTGKLRYSIGNFQDAIVDGEHIGIFKLVILNFGKTIYEKFSDPNCPNQKIVKQMKVLSDSYTKRKLFSKAEFEEQTLWTLYALQQGVTSKADWRRGHGSIAFIDSFFNLKGSQEKDNISYLSIVSGNTRITFDGTFRIREVVKGKQNEKFKMMTFNHEGDIENKPDKNYVTFADNYFPGTIISAKICIKEINTEVSNNE